MSTVVHRGDGARKLTGAVAKDQRFHYSDPAQPPIIRLLHLSPDADAASPLRGYIQTSNLHAINTPNFKYEALSYTWDSQARKERLIVQEDAYIEIGSNLAAFLHQRRDPKDTVVLWVDAICINQQDVEERNFLVSIMHTLYLASESLAIWLGSESENSALAMLELVDIGKPHAYETLPKIPLHICQAIQDLLQRPWWKRIWIVQEVCYGACIFKTRRKEAVAVQCGEKSIPWATLVIACARLHLNKHQLPCSVPEVDHVLLLDSGRSDVPRMPLLESEMEVASDALRLVADYRQCNATDPRDKIYGLLGLIIPTKPAEKDKSLYRVEYRDSIRTVYTRFAAGMVQKSLIFELLRECGGAPGLESIHGLPSWIPDWSLSRREIALPDHNQEKQQGVPWWAVPRVSYPGPGIVNVCHTPYPEEIREEMEKVLRNTRIPLESTIADPANSEPLPISPCCDHQRYSFRTPIGRYNALEHPTMSRETRRRFMEHELQMQKSFLCHWLDKKEGRRTVYAAGGDKKGDVAMNLATEELEIDGIIWDSITEIAQNAFPEDLESSWEASTHFMVNVGQRKQLAVQSKRASPYKSEEDRGWAFWDAMAAGQNTDLISSCHHLLLPVIPESWEMNEAPLIHCRPHDAEWSELRNLMGQGLAVEARYPDAFNEVLDPPLARFSREDAEQRKARWEELGKLWSAQPYDLYHRPFILPNTVPDPYWDSRVRLDVVAKALSYMPRAIQGYFGKGSDDDPSVNDVDAAEAYVHDRLRGHPPVVPLWPKMQSDFDLEKYALGRLFFITQRGYFGIGPAEAKPGDQVVVFPGAQVPMILRRVRPGKYKVIGESYVSGIMKEEVMKKVSEGECKVETVTLV
ncbi:hypothetical protein CC79DRAFT_1400690 [Sarocladium strictum]